MTGIDIGNLYLIDSLLFDCCNHNLNTVYDYYLRNLFGNNSYTDYYDSNYLVFVGIVLFDCYSSSILHETIDVFYLKSFVNLYNTMNPF
jgi:hypothetical protein